MPRKKTQQQDEEEEENFREEFISEYVIDARILALYRLLFGGGKKRY